MLFNMAGGASALGVLIFLLQSTMVLISKKLAFIGALPTVAALVLAASNAAPRQKPSSKPSGSWDSQAIHATFDTVRIDDNGHLLFYYVLNNLTESDYRIDDGTNMVVMARRRGQRNALIELSEKDIKVFYPIVLPAKQRHILVMRDLRRRYKFESELKEKENPTPKQELAEQRKLQRLIERASPSFNGFALFDKASGREIDLPKGW
jgi:hypothetical protein